MIMTPHLNVKPQSTLTFTRNFIHDSHLLDVHIFHLNTDGRNAAVDLPC